METKIGKIEDLYIGSMDGRFGVFITLGDSDGMVGDARVTWENHNAKFGWTVDNQRIRFGDIMFWLRDLMREAKCVRADQLIGKPVEIALDSGQLRSWRILTEAL